MRKRKQENNFMRFQSEAIKETALQDRGESSRENQGVVSQ